MSHADAVSPQIARTAAEWLVKLQSADAPTQDFLACAEWRAAHPDHESAWQRAQHVLNAFAALPSQWARPVLDRPRQPSRRSALRLLTLALTVPASGYVAYRYSPWRSWLADQRTGCGERRQLQLPDGSRLHLNTDTAVDIDFGATRRQLHLLHGEILVDTATDARPFLVSAPGGFVRPIGTRFSVRQRAVDSSDIAVLAGAVQLRPASGSGPTLLRAGQQARLAPGGVSQIQQAALGSGSWVDGVLHAQAMPLATLLTELERYRHGVVRCDPAIAGLPITGVFQLDQTDAVLAALPAMLPVAVRSHTRFWVSVGPG
ncbi:FecR domain-containing protein [Chitinolyticbacter meiyuanensis]|uniref:FecR domain-containing protein n=1 Tax=Chitinolyticbacter meiyuanensis TaxID=682798 RepID=UPI00165296C7|nr:FecR family protein [Chitinolyticbacter meiyuanensis]